ncbi:MAG: hypothetical protein DLM60_21595 [Pseudonocardiales bacterium]|nr:MAG: hypothetical protein DLM60_21595 [Pseudonocardiales bacterium]
MYPESADDGSRASLPVDYDSDPARFVANQAATARFSAVSDVHVLAEERLASIEAAPVLDLGGGNGTLVHLVADRGIRTVVLDQAAYVDQAPWPHHGQPSAPTPPGEVSEASPLNQFI